MKIVVFGANGRTGVHVVEYAKRRGHRVRAFVRSSKKLRFDSSGIDVVEGNVNSFQDVRAAVDGQNAIISVIGHRRRVDPDMQTRAMHHIIAASHRDKSPDRIISLSGTGIRFKGDKFSLIDRLLNTVVRLIDYTRVTDGVRHAAALKSSDMDWTILRVLKLTNGRLKGPKGYKLKAHGPPKVFISRKDVATILLKLAEKSSYVRKAPIVGRKQPL